MSLISSWLPPRAWNVGRCVAKTGVMIAEIVVMMSAKIAERKRRWPAKTSVIANRSAVITTMTRTQSACASDSGGGIAWISDKPKAPIHVNRYRV